MASHSSCGSRATKACIALRQRVLIFDLADPFAAGESRIVDVDDERFWPVHQRQRLRDHAGKFRIDQDDLGAAMIELEGDRGGIEPDVERVEHGARHRHRKMHLVHRRDVRQHRRDRVAAADAAAGEIRRKAPAARIGLRPGEDAALIDGADMIGIDGGGARQEAQRRQRPRNWPASCPVRCCTGFALPLIGLSPISRCTYRNPIEIHGNIATTIRPTSSASR